MPTTQPNESVAHPETSKGSPPAASPAAPRKAVPGATKTPIKRVAANSNKPMPMPAAKPAPSKLLKSKKIKLVRDSFTIPKLEYLMLDALKLRAGTLEKSVKKSELIRAGIKALAAMPDSQFLAAVKAVTPSKIGHRAKH
jgi:hypothetical protein